MLLCLSDWTEYLSYFPNRKRLNAGNVPENKEYAVGTVPASKEYAAGTVPANKQYAGTLYKVAIKKN